MARIRTLKPEFFQSRSLARISRDARLTFQGLWIHADDAGNGIDEPRVLKGLIWPLDDDVTPADVGAHLDALEREGCILRYRASDGETYYHIIKWTEHQVISKPSKPKYPSPPARKKEHSGSPPGVVEEHYGSPLSTGSDVGRMEGKGKEGKGKETPPTPPRDDPPPLNPPNVNPGGTATPTTPGGHAPPAHLADRALERIVAAMPPVLSGSVRGDRRWPDVTEAARAAVAAGWRPADIADRVNQPGWRGVTHPAGAMLARLLKLAEDEPPQRAAERRQAAEAQHDAERQAEREQAERQREALDAHIDDLPDDERDDLARKAWRELPQVMRGPEPDINRPAVRGMARSILAEKVSA